MERPIHPPSPEAPPLGSPLRSRSFATAQQGGEEGEARVLLRSRPASLKLRSGCFEAHRAKKSRADKATAKQNTASERAASPRLRSRRFEARSAEKGFHPTGGPEGATLACRAKRGAGRGLPVGLHPGRAHGERACARRAYRGVRERVGCPSPGMSIEAPGGPALSSDTRGASAHNCSS